MPAHSRILLLSSSLGMGHDRAAEAVAEALKEREPSVRTAWLDFWSLMDPQVARVVKEGYLTAVTGSPDLYDALYGLDGGRWMTFFREAELPPELVPVTRNALEDDSFSAGGSPIRGRNLDQFLFMTVLGTYFRDWGWMAGHLRQRLVRGAYRLLARRMKRRIDEFRPNAVVSTQMLPAGVLAGVPRSRNGQDAVRVGVTTDYGLHDFWYQAGMDRYCVATEEMARDLLGREGPSHAVHVTGIPLAASFRSPPSPRAARLALGLSAHDSTVLLTGGGAGIGVRRALERMLESAIPARILVVGASGRGASSELEPLRRKHPGRLRLLDDPENRAVPVAAADVVVGKPGGVSVSEALACGRPFLAVNSLGGQENFNVSLLERWGAGRKVNGDSLCMALAEWLSNPTALAGAQARARTLGCTQGAQEVARHVLEATEESGSPRLVAHRGAE